MPARKFNILAAVLALLAITAPAHAATIQWDLRGVTGFEENPAQTVTGFFDYNTTTQTFPYYYFSVSDNPLIQGGVGTFALTPSNSYIQSGGPNSIQIYNDCYSDDNAEILSLSPSGATASYDGTSGPLLLVSPSESEVAHLINIGDLLNIGGGRYVSLQEGGDTVLQGELVETAVTPLPPALPMFGAALLALVGFAAWQRRAARG
jgi:hypothetical protein